MIKCFNCGRVFDESELKAVEESRGEFWGAPAYETMHYCPFCGSDEYDDYYPEEGEDEEE